MALGPEREWERIAREICDVFGLEHAQRMVITLEVGKIPTIQVAFMPETDRLEKTAAALKKFRLVPMKNDIEDGHNG
jgi:hypothetical protein